MIIYALRDRLLGTIVVETVMVMANDEVVKRYLRDNIQGNSPAGRHPEDFELVACGLLDPASGSVVSPELGSVARVIAPLSLVLSSPNVPLHNVDAQNA